MCVCVCVWVGVSVTEREGNGDTNSAVPASGAAESQAGMAAPAQSPRPWRVSARTCRLPSSGTAGWGRWEPGAAAAGIQGLGTCGESRPNGSRLPGPAPSAAPALARRLQAPPTTRGPPTAPTAFHPATRRAARLRYLLRVWKGREGAREPKSMVGRRGSPPCPQPRLRTLHPQSPRGLPSSRTSQGSASSLSAS